MKRILIYSLLLVAILGQISCKSRARKDVREGNKMYKEFKYNEALKFYASALVQDTELLQAQFNLSAALFKLNKFDSAVAILQRLVDNPIIDSLQKPMLQYNLSTTRLAWAVASKKQVSDLTGSISNMQATVNEQMDIIDKVKQSIDLDSMVVLQDSLEKNAMELIYKSINGYKLVLRVNPGDTLSRYNLAYAQLLIPKQQYDDMKNKDKDQQETLTLFAKRLKGKVDSLVKNYVFDTAYHMMDKGVKKDTTVKTYNDYIKKLKDVNDIKYKKK